MSQWLTLSAASKLLGIHPTTLRQWADSGKIPSYRTPGGHRRFRSEDIRTFLIRASHAETDREISIEESLFTMALVKTRRELQQFPPSEQIWYSQFDEEGIEQQRKLGRALFENAIRYLVFPNQREMLITEGRALGRSYALSSQKYQISLLDTVRAFQFFRQKLLRTLTSTSTEELAFQKEEILVREHFDTFFDEVLFGLIETYERQLLEEKEVIETSG